MLVFTTSWVQKNWLLPHDLAKKFSREKTQPPNLFFFSWRIQLCSIGRRLTQIFQQWKPNAGSLDYQTGPEWSKKSDKHQSASQSWSFTLLLQPRFSSAWSVRTQPKQWGQSKEISTRLPYEWQTSKRQDLCFVRNNYCMLLLFAQLAYFGWCLSQSLKKIVEDLASSV